MVFAVFRYYTSHDLTDYWFIVFLSIDFYHSANRVKVTSFVLIHSTQFLCHQKDSRVIKHTNQTQTQTQTQIQMVISEKRIWFDQSQVRRSPLLLMMKKKACLLIKNLFDKRCPWNYSKPQYNNLTWFTPNCFVKMKNAFSSLVNSYFSKLKAWIKEDHRKTLFFRSLLTN